MSHVWLLICIDVITLDFYTLQQGGMQRSEVVEVKNGARPVELAPAPSSNADVQQAGNRFD